MFVGRVTEFFVWWCLRGLSVVCTLGLCSFAIEKAVRVGDKICEGRVFDRMIVREARGEK